MGCGRGARRDSLGRSPCRWGSWKEPWRVFPGGKSCFPQRNGAFPSLGELCDISNSCFPSALLSLHVQLLSLSPCLALVAQRRGRRRIFIAI